MLRFLITAGPTRESIDPVRFISNRSSGKMGFALAEAAQKMGHKVTLISGPVSIPFPKQIDSHSVETADEMRKSVLSHFKKADIIIMCAAVADYRPCKISAQKIKKTKKKLILHLEKTPDILLELGKRKSRKQFLVGFAAETRHLLTYASRKLKSKNLDLIVANPVGKKGSGFESDENQVHLLHPSGTSIRWPRMKKSDLGKKLVRYILSLHQKLKSE